MNETDYSNGFINMNLRELLVKCEEISPVKGKFAIWTDEQDDVSMPSDTAYSCGIRTGDKSLELYNEQGVPVCKAKDPVQAARNMLKKLYGLDEMTKDEAKRIVERYINKYTNKYTNCHNGYLRVFDVRGDEGEYRVMLWRVRDDFKVKYFNKAGDIVMDTSNWHIVSEGYGDDFDSAYIEMAASIKRRMGW